MLPSVSRNYYEEQYDAKKDEEGVPTLPVCWSHAADKPEPNVPKLQHTNCADCPQNVPGSGQGTTKACRFKRSISILLVGDNSGEVYQINIPAKSLFGKSAGGKHPFEAYVKYLLSNGEAPDTVVTKVAYDEDAANMELYFAPMRRLTDQEYTLVQSAQSKPETDKYTKISVGQADALAAPKVNEREETQKPPAPKIERREEPEPDEVAVAAPQESSAVELEEENTEEVIAEPQKRTKKKEELVPEPDDSLADVIAAWGADEE